MKKSENNYAFIDGQNLYLGVRELGWKLDYQRFRVYLAEKYGVKKAYLFMGYVPGNQALYKDLQEWGYLLVFKHVLIPNDGRKPKGNVDADLVLQSMIEYENYERALLVTSDGDFYSLVDYLYTQKKLERVLAPCRSNCSILLRQKAKDRMNFIEDLKGILEFGK